MPGVDSHGRSHVVISERTCCRRRSSRGCARWRVAHRCRGAARLGERDPNGAARAGVQSILLGLLVSALISAVGIGYGASLLRLMGATDSVVSSGSGFTRVLLGGNATVVLLFLINAVFRGAGDAA